MPAVGAMQPGEALGEVTAAVVFFDDLDSIGAEGAVGFAVVGFVVAPPQSRQDRRPDKKSLNKQIPIS